MELAPSPLLVAATVAGPDLHSGAVGGARPGHVKAETGPDPHDGAVGVEGPLLVAAAVAVVDLHPSARRRGEAWHVEALVAVHLQFPIGQRGPLLVATPVTVPDLQQRAVGGGRPWHVEAAIGAHTSQDPGRPTATTAAATIIGQAPAILEPVEAGLIGDAQREAGAAAVQCRDGAGGVLTGARALRLGGLLDASPQD